MGQHHRPYRVRIPSRRVHDRQTGRLRHRSHPARCGPVQGGTALRTEHRARPPTASALGRQHQIGQVPPPPPHAHHCANAEADRPPLWITTCGKLRSPIRRTRTTVPIANLWPPTPIRSAEHSPRISSPYKRIRTTNPPVRPTNPARPTSRESPPAPETKAATLTGASPRQKRPLTTARTRRLTPDRPAPSRPRPPSATAPRKAAVRSRPPSRPPTASRRPRTRRSPSPP
jgi:hypothetical protein